jgi:hypothetical protein
MDALAAALPAPLRDFLLARVAQALALAGRVQDGLVAAGLLAPGVDARWAIALAAYACWWVFKLTVLRRVFAAVVSLFETTPRISVPLTPDEADATPKGRKWVRPRASASARLPVCVCVQRGRWPARRHAGGRRAARDAARGARRRAAACIRRACGAAHRARVRGAGAHAARKRLPAACLLVRRRGGS